MSVSDLPADGYAPDGSPVPLYLRLPPRTDDAALIDRLLPPGASVLDLGCGTGRLAEPLAARGHPVTGVDNEPQMLAALHHTTGVVGDLTGIALGATFGGVLLMSHLVNSADRGFVDAALRTVRRHLDPGGVAVVERFAPGWVDDPAETARELDGVRYTVRRHQLNGGVLTASVEYEFDGLRAVQRFSARDVDDASLAELAVAAGLRVSAPLTEDGRMVLLVPARA